MIRNSRVMFVILLALLLPIHVFGQSAASEPPPSEGALFLLLPVGAEGVSLGRAMTAVSVLEPGWTFEVSPDRTRGHGRKPARWQVDGAIVVDFAAAPRCSGCLVPPARWG